MDKTSFTAAEAARYSRVLRRALAEGAHLTTYRVLRRVAGLGRWAGQISVHVARVYQAAVTDLDRGGRLPRSYVIRWAEPHDRLSLTAFFGPDRNVARRFERGDRCLLALSRDKICAAVWFVPGPGEYPEDAKWFDSVFHVPAGVTFSYDGKGTRWGAWGTLMARWLRFLQQLGIREIVTLIDWGNAVSINSHRSLRYRSIGVVGCIGLAHWSQPFYQAGGPTWRMLPGQIGPLSLEPAAPGRSHGRQVSGRGGRRRAGLRVWPAPLPLAQR